MSALAEFLMIPQVKVGKDIASTVKTIEPIAEYLAVSSIVWILFFSGN